MLKQNLVVALYSPPEYYPPTLNALENLYGEYQNIYIIYRNYDGIFDWKYPDHVKLIPTGERIAVKDAETASVSRKIRFFIQYSSALKALMHKTNPDTLLIYDYMPIAAYRMIKLFLRVPRILWYHNHDVGDKNFLRKWSIGWLAWKSEKWIFPKLNIFSLPSLDRKQYFPMDKLNGEFFFVPNYPSVKVFEKYRNIQRYNEKFIKIVFQGSVGPLHGLEEIIPLLNETVNGKNLQLIVRGLISEDYKRDLIEIAIKNGVENKLVIISMTGYGKVLEQAHTYNVGIGIYRKQDIMNKTIVTASNKIYEYAASGMPVLLYDNEQFRKNLDHYSWTFFTDCTPASLLGCLGKIDRNFDELSKQAKTDFVRDLNFEKYFLPVSKYLDN
jgi:glycosyltransferase involved in cell wall biosynthesis